MTGTEEFVAITTPATVTTVGNVVQWRDMVVELKDTMSDPRVSGKGTCVCNQDQDAGGAVQFGQYRLENEGGSWEGTFAGMIHSGAVIEDATAWLVGEGGYAGLSYYFHVNGSDGSYEVDGLIFPGLPPAPAALPGVTPEPGMTPAAGQTPGLPAAGPAGRGVHVTGTETVVALVQAPTTTTVGDVVQVRDIIATTADATSDPRVSGSGTIGGNYDKWGANPEATQWGTYRLENDGGSWEGTWRGIAYGYPPVEDASVWLVGTRGYAGLSYYFHFHGSAGTYAIDGLVFPGLPPAP